MQENDINKSQEEEMEIDLLELAMTLWKKRKKLAVWSACGAVLGLVVAFSIPKENATSVKLAPEVADSKGGGGSLGVNGRLFYELIIWSRCCVSTALSGCR